MFTTSERTDLLQGRKLDKIEVSAEKVVKSYDFIYSYFNATNVGGNGFVPFNASTYGSTYKLRLKLQSLQESSGAIHNFTYNATPLPAKNSFAQDYWGFYNGQLSNTNLVPNPVRLKQTHLADNGNNHSAHLASAQAAMLTEIQYPTGGKVALEYELNEFSNYWVPDINTTTNTISTGNGLRIQAISFKEHESAKAKRTLYSYEGGKAAVALQMYRQYPISVIQFGTYQTLETFYRIDELCSKGFFSTNALGSFNGVGYDKVVKKEVDMDGIPSGYTETYFNNTPDIVSNTANGTSHIGATLPAIKNRDNPENGTVKEVRYHKSYYNEQGVLSSKLVKKVVQTYITKHSWQNHPNYEYNYGARIFSYGSLVYKVDLLSQYVKWYPTPLNLIGYYPIYDLWSLPSITTTTEYDEKSNSLVSEKYVIYDDMDQLTMEKVTTSDGRYEEVGYSHPQHDLSNPMYYALYSANRLSEVVKAGKKNTSNVYGDVTELSLLQKEYTWVGSDKIMEHKVTLTNSLSNQTINEVTYDLYDPTNGRLLQMTNKGNMQSMCWGYSGNYLTAEAVNAKASEIFYSSFEEGGWDNNTIGYDNTRSRTGRYSGRIDLNAGEGAEKTAHSTEWLNVSLSAATKFKYSGWVYSNGPQAEIFLFMKKAGEPGYSTHSVTTSEINKWVYLEGEYTVPADITQLNIRIDNNGVGSVWFDDIRLHPSSAQMTTYTYEPLVGMTSQTDINNNTIYYEYDGLGRLLHIRDKERNILKKFCYNYQGQVEDCSLNTSPAWVATGQTRCKPCSLNASYTTNIQQHREVDNNPYSPTYQTAERWVDDGSSGSCSYQEVWQNASPAEIRCETDANGRNTGNQVQRQVNLNPCSPNTERWVVIGTNTTACTLPQDYARLSYENTMHYASYSSADVQVSFYANSQGTTPTTVTGLDVHYASQDFCNGSGSYVQSCSGTVQVLEYGAWIYYLNDNWYCPPGELCPSPDCYVDWYLESGTGYSIIY